MSQLTMLVSEVCVSQLTMCVLYLLVRILFKQVENFSTYVPSAKKDKVRIM